MEEWSGLFEAEVLPRMDPTSRAVLAQVNRAGRDAAGWCRLTTSKPVLTLRAMAATLETIILFICFKRLLSMVTCGDTTR